MADYTPRVVVDHTRPMISGQSDRALELVTESLSTEQIAQFDKMTIGMHSAQQPSASGKCHLKAIPAELREHIWYLALIHKHPIRVIKDQDEKGLLLAGDPPLAQTCRSIRAETMGIYWSNNTFCASIDASIPFIPKFWFMSLWINWLGDEQRQFLEHIVVEVCHEQWRPTAVDPEDLEIDAELTMIRILNWFKEEAPGVKEGIVKFMADQCLQRSDQIKLEITAEGVEAVLEYDLEHAGRR